MTYLSENATITFADGSGYEVKRLTEESSEEALSLEFSTGDYSGIRAAFLDAEKTKEIKTANATYKNFTIIVGISAQTEDKATDRVKVELKLDQKESEIDYLRSSLAEMQDALLEITELIYNKSKEEPIEEPVEEEPQEEEITDGHTDEEIADSFVEDVESVKDSLPQEEES